MTQWLGQHLWGEMMNDQIPLVNEQFFDEISYQGKTIKVGDRVIVQQAGQSIKVEVCSIIKKHNHYWVGYDDNKYKCPWPLVGLT